MIKFKKQRKKKKLLLELLNSILNVLQTINTKTKFVINYIKIKRDLQEKVPKLIQRLLKNKDLKRNLRRKKNISFPEDLIYLGSSINFIDSWTSRSRSGTWSLSLELAEIWHSSLSWHTSWHTSGSSWGTSMSLVEFGHNWVNNSFDFFLFLFIFFQFSIWIGL